jgi:hypothetical protein
MRRWTSLAAFLAVVALASVAAVRAEKEDGTDKTRKAEAAVRKQVDLADLGTAFQLVEYGRLHQAPETLITAAGLLKNVARARIKDLKVEKLDITDSKGNAVEDKGEPEPASKIELGKEADELIIEGQALALKQKVNVNALVKSVENRKLPAEGASDVLYYGRTLGGENTMVFPLKVDGDQVTSIAIRSTEAVRVVVSRDKEGKQTLAASLATAGNLTFKPTKGEAATRGVVIVRPVRPRPVRVVVRVRPPFRGRRAIGTGDTEVFVRVENPSKTDAAVDLFFN